VAHFFATPTARVNQYRDRNASRFTEQYAFQLTDQEWENLKSQNVISSAHGGRRNRPWAYTEHGFAMLSMGMKGPQSDRIAHVVIDTFVQYRRGVLPAGPVLGGVNGKRQRVQLLDSIYAQMQALAAMPLPTGQAAGVELATITKKAVDRIKAVIDAPVVKQEHILAEIARVEAETSRIYAETQRTEAETARIWMEVVKGRLEVLGTLRDMASQLERDAVAELMGEAFEEDGEGVVRLAQLPDMLGQT